MSIHQLIKIWGKHHLTVLGVLDKCGMQHRAAFMKILEARHRAQEASQWMFLLETVD